MKKLIALLLLAALAIGLSQFLMKQNEKNLKDQTVTVQPLA